MLAKIKLNSIEILRSQILIDLKVSHEEFKTFLNENKKDEKMKENIRYTKRSDEKDELSDNNNKNIREIMKMHRINFFFS